MKSYIDVLNETFGEIDKILNKLAKNLTEEIKYNFDTRLLFDKDKEDKKLNTLGTTIIFLCAQQIFIKLCKEANK